MLSATLNKELTEQARESLYGHWKFTAFITFVWTIINVSVQFVPLIGGLLPLFLNGAFTLGFTLIYIRIIRQTEVSLATLFSGFSDYIRAFLTYLFMNILILLWSLLLIIPGIIAAYSYILTYYILIDEPSLTPLQAIKKSKLMMKGYKWKAACLGFRFFGWGILAILTLGIGFLWLLPYMGMTYAKFYEDIKEHDTGSNTVLTDIPSYELANNEMPKHPVPKHAIPDVGSPVPYRKGSHIGSNSILENIRAKNVEMKSQS